MSESDVRRGADLTVTAHEELEGQVKAVRDRLDDVQVGWKGTGQVSFTNLMAAWDMHSKKMLTTLHGLAENLGATEKDFQATEGEQEAAYSNLNARLGDNHTPTT